jgi:hypothetical protein
MDLPMTINPMPTERMCHSVEITADNLNMLETLVRHFVGIADGAMHYKMAVQTLVRMLLLHVHQPM